MARIGTTRTITKGVYHDSNGFEVRIVVGGHTYRERMPKDSTLKELKAKRTELENQGRTDTPRAERGTLRSAAHAYLKRVKHLTSADDCEDHLNAWCLRLGDVLRHRITEQDVLDARDAWREAGLSPKTINNRVGTLRNLYHRLDGKKAKTPCDELAQLPTSKTIIQRVSDALLRKIDRTLQQREQDPTKQFDGAKTRARFRVFVSTGKRPCEIMRAQPGDVDLKARVWVPRDAKGGYCAGVVLNDDQLAAWRLFIAAGAWGPFNHGNFGRVIRHAGWPQGVRPYQARHTTWITASEKGIDLSDIAAGAGHTDVRLTRRMYVPVLNSRLARLSEALAGRFGGWPRVPKSRTAKKSHRRKGKSAA